MIEQLLEAAFMAKIAELEIAGLVVYGFWQPTELGVLKAIETAAPAALGVVTAPRSYETYTSAKAVFTTVATLKIRRDSNPTGAELAQYAEPVFDLFQSWQMSIDKVKNDFTLTDNQGAPLFTPHGFKLDGGAPRIEPDAGAWSVTQTLTLRGVIKERKNL